MEESVRFKPAGGGSFNPLSVYPIGSIYISVSGTNPAELFGGGTWERLKDRFLLAAGDTYAAGSTGGEAEHVLTVDEMPAHKHTIKRPQWFFADKIDPNSGSIIGIDNSVLNHSYNGEQDINYSGGSQPHNNLPPYLAVYMWQRVA